MTQIHVDKDRSYKMHGGKALDALNEKLAEVRKDGERLHQMHPTKGRRLMSDKRLAAQFKIEPSLHGWALRAASMTGSDVGGVPQERGERRPSLPHQGARECARRRKQISAA